MKTGYRRLVFAFTAISISLAARAAENWNAGTFSDPSSFEEFESVYQDSTTTIKDESASKDVTPRLEFRCSPGNNSVIARIDWGRFISSFSTEVGFKVDDGRFTWLKWKTDSSEEITYSPSRDDSRTLVELLTSGDKLLVEVSRYSEGPVNASFELTGFADALAGNCE